MSIKSNFLNLKELVESNIYHKPYSWIIGGFIAGAMLTGILATV